MNNRFDWKLFWAISLPVVFVVILSAFYFIPSFMSSPQYDFIYSTDRAYNAGYQLSSKGGRITATPHNYNYNSKLLDADLPEIDLNSVEIKRYLVREKKSITLTAAEANKLELSNESTAPDGYKIDGASYRGGLVNEVLIGGSYSSYKDVYLIKDFAKDKIEIDTDSSYDFNFLGWVITD